MKQTIFLIVKKAADRDAAEKALSDIMGFCAATAEISFRLLAAIAERHAEYVKPSGHSLQSDRPEYNEV